MTTELYGAATCSFTQELREWLEWKRRDYVEFDVEKDSDALDRMLLLTGGQRTVPVLVEDGRAVQIGWQGRGCVVNPPNR